MSILVSRMALNLQRMRWKTDKFCYRYRGNYRNFFYYYCGITTVFTVTVGLP